VGAPCVRRSPLRSRPRAATADGGATRSRRTRPAGPFVRRAAIAAPGVRPTATGRVGSGSCRRPAGPAPLTWG